MIKKWLVLTLLLGILVFARLSSPNAPEQSLGSGPMAFQPPIPSNPIKNTGNSCPSACSARLTATDGKIQELEAEVAEIRDAMNHDIPILDERTQDANRRLKQLESNEEREDLDPQGDPIAKK